MYIDTDKIITMTAANQNFSAVARQTESDGKSEAIGSDMIATVNYHSSGSL